MRKRIAAVCAATALALAGFAGPASAGGPPPPPNCESGQLHAAGNGLRHGNLEQALKHTGKGLACLLGEDPGQGGG